MAHIALGPTDIPHTRRPPPARPPRPGERGVTVWDGNRTSILHSMCKNAEKDWGWSGPSEIACYQGYPTRRGERNRKVWKREVITCYVRPRGSHSIVCRALALLAARVPFLVCPTLHFPGRCFVVVFVV